MVLFGLNMKDVRNELFAYCQSQLKLKVEELQKAIASQREAMEGETKSSAGDKYETGTAMAHLEIEKLGGRLNQVKNDLIKLTSFSNTSKSNTIKAGSLVKTERNLFWISISMGEVKLEGNRFFVISPLSPIAQAFLGKEVGFEFTFNKTKDRILEVL